MGKLQKFPESIIGGLNDPSQWGGCPVCYHNDGYLNVEEEDGIEHWFVCKRHKKKWRVGVNLFSLPWGVFPDEQIETSLTINRYRLADYHQVSITSPFDPRTSKAKLVKKILMMNKLFPRRRQRAVKDNGN